MDLRTAAEWVVLVGAAVGAFGVLWAKVLGPFIGRPIGKAIRGELEDLVEQIVVRLNNELLRRIGSHENRLTMIESRATRIEGRLDLLEADQLSLTKRFRSHFGTLHEDEEE